MDAPVITFLTDYGLEDAFVGVCHGVIAGICPDAHVIDLTHGVPRGNVRAGALMLRGALGYLPVGVHLAVVDPGVGGERRAVAVRTADGRRFVGPDNGLLSLCFEAGGGLAEAVDIGGSSFVLQPVSATFHGRDIFAPVAARLVAGAVARQLRWANRRRSDFAAFPAHIRLARLLCEIAEVCGREQPDCTVELAVPLSQPDLAAMIAIAQATVQKAVHDLRDAGLITTGYRRLVLLDPVRLAKLAETASFS